MYLKIALREIRHALMRLFTRNDINAYERRVFSQNGEDGILRELFARIGATRRFCVEFGVEDGLQCNTALLARKGGWSGVMIEGDPQMFARLDDNYRAFPTIRRVSAFINRENIVELFQVNGVPPEFDLLSIDIDGNDYWIWDVLGAAFHPHVVVIEYNATRPPPERWVMRYNPEHRWCEDGYMGASLASLEELGRRLGYALLGTDEKGVNAFFLRADLVQASRFTVKPAASAYHPTSYGFVRTDGPFESM